MSIQNCVPVKRGHNYDQNEWSYMTFRYKLVASMEAQVDEENERKFLKVSVFFEQLGRSGMKIGIF